MKKKEFVTFNKIEFKEAIKAFKAKDILIPKKFLKELPLNLREYAFYVAGLNKINTIKTVKASLKRSLKKGETFVTWKKSLSKKTINNMVATPETVFRTNMQGASLEGTWSKVQDTKDLLPYVMYTAVGDAATRPAHAALDGIIRLIDDSFWDNNRPINGYNCRCDLITLTERQAKRHSEKGKGLNKKVPKGAGPDKGFSGKQDIKKSTITKHFKASMKGLPAESKKVISKHMKKSNTISKKWFKKNKKEFKVNKG